jgi:hypothetical protein
MTPVFNVNQLMFIETGEYHQQAARPYNSYVDDTRNIENLREATQDGRNISANSVAGIASTLIRPSSEAGRDINITQGWGERRYRFFMEVEMMVNNTPTRKIVIGYTDHVGVTMAGTLDPNMKMFINNVIVLRMIGPNNWQIFESNHIVVNDLIVHGNGYTSDNVVMRPEDVFNSLQATNMYTEKSMEIYDFRANVATGARKSSRDNTNHNQYLAKSMKALHTAQNNADHQMGNVADIYQEATTKVRESSIVDDGLLREWDDETGYFDEGYITYGKLCEMSPSTFHTTQHFELKGAIKQATIHTAGTQHFKGSDITSIMATILSNTVPPMAMECLLTRVCFSATNATLNGAVDARITTGRFMDSQRGIPQGFIQEIPLDAYLELFLDRLINIVMPDVTNNWNYIVTIDMEIDILGETYISISTNGEPAVPYVIPSFADGLTAPIIGNNNSDLSSLASDINLMTQNVGMVTETQGNSPIITSSSNW